MPAARKPASSDKLYSIVPLSFNGQDLPVGSELQDLLPEELHEGLVERGEASHTRPKDAQ